MIWNSSRSHGFPSIPMTFRMVKSFSSQATAWLSGTPTGLLGCLVLADVTQATVLGGLVESLPAEVGVVTGQPVGHLTNGIVVVPGVHELPDTDQEGTQVGVVGLVVQARVRNVGLGPSHGSSGPRSIAAISQSFSSICGMSLRSAMA